jgi:hypothetical protein
MKVTIKTNNDVLVVFNNAHGVQTYVDKQDNFMAGVLSLDDPISEEKFIPEIYTDEQKEWRFDNIKTIEIVK